MKWIDREVEFPDVDRILCCWGDEIFVCVLIEGKWGRAYWCYESVSFPDWTHWMPLPTPPHQPQES
jgi:uncharacterized protein DUF551